MEGINTEAINVCNRLIQNCQDAADGYRTATMAVDSDNLKTLFMDIAESREFMITDLQGEIVSLGSEPNDGGSLLGALHRGWMNIKSVVSGHDPNEILAECIRGEQSAIDQYRDALSIELPPLTRELLQGHYERVQQNYQQMRSLEAATR
jgi:uncharacterized protein (TIGR02284 family)